MSIANWDQRVRIRHQIVVNINDLRHLLLHLGEPLFAQRMRNGLIAVHRTARIVHVLLVVVFFLRCSLLRIIRIATAASFAATAFVVIVGLYGRQCGRSRKALPV